MRFLILFFFVSVTAYGQGEAPEWIQDSKRRVIGSYILHWGKGTATTSDLALFKAEQMAFKSMISECGGKASNLMTPRDRWEEGPVDGIYTAYSRVSMAFSDCEFVTFNLEATKENKAIAEAQKMYDSLVIIDSDPELVKRIDMMELGNKLLKIQNEMQWEMKQYKESLKKDAEVAYAQQQAEIDSLSEEVNAMKEERAWKKYEKELAAKMKKAQEEEASYSPEKRQCILKVRRMENQAMMNNTLMNEGLNEIHALAAQCARMK